MTDDELFDQINRIVAKTTLSPTMFSEGARTTATFITGLGSTHVVRPGGGHAYWHHPLKVGLLMELFSQASGCISTAMLVTGVSDSLYTQDQLESINDAIDSYASAYVAKNYRTIKSGQETQLGRTIKVVNKLPELSRVLGYISDPNTSIDIEYVRNVLADARAYYMMPMCNKDVEAHPMAVEMLRRFVESIENRVICNVCKSNSRTSFVAHHADRCGCIK